MTEIFPHLARPEGRLFFAGCYTADRFLHGTMQGAIQSGIRVAQEVDAT
jgi:monoamine oxidase